MLLQLIVWFKGKGMKTTILKYNVIIKKEGKYFVAYAPTLGISDFGKTIDLASPTATEPSASVDR